MAKRGYGRPSIHANAYDKAGVYVEKAMRRLQYVETREARTLHDRLLEIHMKLHDLAYPEHTNPRSRL